MSVAELQAMTRIKLGVLMVAWLSACVGSEDAGDGSALARLQRVTGGPVDLEVGTTGATLALSRPLPGRSGDPAVAAAQFLADYHDLFQLAGDEVASFVVVRVDVEPRGARHVILQRSYQGEPVFHGQLSIHLDADNRVFRALGQSAYRITAPVNTRALSSVQAVGAAARALGVVGAFSSEATRQIFQVAAEDTRFAYGVTLSWLDGGGAQHAHLVMVDAASAAPLAMFDLVDTFTGRVYTASPGAAPTVDGRTLVSFDGDLVASPSGWVGSARKTVGNNAVAATDLDHNNVVGSSEVQPAADASDAFDFPFSPTLDPAGAREAAVTNAFYFVNAWHDHMYALGFTESAANFQTSNFGRGGAQNDEVQIDVQDGGGIDNATFSTPPDGSRPRLQLYLFDLATGGVHQDSAFDPSVVYHEQSHGLSNRLVGGGTTACLEGLQSAGMGEGWSDFMAASILGDPVIGAYVTGNAAVGVRLASMASSSFTYANLQDRSLSEKHDIGEIWAATLWDVRTALGAAVAEQLVVSGMKLTPCSPSMVQARDAILAADATLYAGANRCALYTAFAGRLLGTGASSLNDDATSSVVTSAEVPSDCGEPLPSGLTKTFTATDVPRAIPDNNSTGVASVIHTRGKKLALQQVRVTATIAHTYRGDLVIQLIAPDGQVATLSDRAGGSADDFSVTDLDLTSSFTPGTRASGAWRLYVRDTAINDVGEITGFSLTINAIHQP